MIFVLCSEQGKKDKKKKVEKVAIVYDKSTPPGEKKGQFYHSCLHYP